MSYKDWIATLHKHHDHAGGFFDTSRARFPETIICGQCNNADGQVKRKLDLPNKFSFSPHELSKFVTGIPHGKITIDYEVAKRIYMNIRG